MPQFKKDIAMRCHSKKICLLIMLTFTALTLSGCSLQTKVANAANKLVENYCTTPEAKRMLVRAWVDDAIQPNKIRIECANDLSVTGE